MPRDRTQAAKTAAEHHTTIVLLELIANTATSSDMHHTTQRLGERIAALCRAEQQRQLKRMDSQLARTRGVETPPPTQQNGASK